MLSVHLSNLLQPLWAPCEQLCVHSAVISDSFFMPFLFPSLPDVFAVCHVRTAFFASIHRVSIIFTSGGWEGRGKKPNFELILSKLSPAWLCFVLWIACLLLKGFTDFLCPALGLMVWGFTLKPVNTELLFFLFWFIFVFPCVHEWVEAKSFDFSLVNSCHIVTGLFFHTCVDFT